MLEDVLSDIGLHNPEKRFDFETLLEPFSHWIASQKVQAEDSAFLAGLIGAFICEFLVEHHSALRVIDGTRILIRLPFEFGIAREFDPYSVACTIARQQQSLSSFLEDITIEKT